MLVFFINSNEWFIQLTAMLLESTTTLFVNEHATIYELSGCVGSSPVAIT